ncbi:hypothetical protein G7068_13735 [Leucobacter viscericola]|uniref:Uncharacterized protein n=1 Tax=Leucobacter viscericola TaxID=2714935 RepID=A0A6G7XHR0_9MICO|nr:hypothetical protein [Leucobacter viscericola]QIK64140.1 hypothetical protein G7068_13735 [Leucobacter viscericola]
MSYLTQAKLAGDQLIIQRVTACAASEGVPDAPFWASQQGWRLSAQPGWDAAYESALASKVSEPGGDSSVISDGMILAAVQAIRKAESPPDPPQAETN